MDEVINVSVQSIDIHDFYLRHLCCNFLFPYLQNYIIERYDERFKF
jgi:hypothetical protein